jgi:hypothetical protein
MANDVFILLKKGRVKSQRFKIGGKICLVTAELRTPSRFPISETALLSYESRARLVLLYI